MRNNFTHRPWLQLSFLETSLLALLLLITGCSKDERIPTPQKDPYSLAAAKTLLEQTNSPLLLPLFSGDKADAPTKSIPYNRNLSPCWDKAIRSQTDSIVRHEIPLATALSLCAFPLGRKPVNLSSVLVIEFHKKQQKSRTFIATLIGTHPSGNLSYSSNKKNFTGIMIISNLKGDFLAGYAYAKGTRQNIRLATSTTNSAIIARYSIRSTTPQTKFMGGTDMVYKFCNSCFSIEPFMGDLCLTCDCWNLDEVIVTANYECPEHGWYPCECKPKCDFCHYFPCRCNGGRGDGEEAEGGAWARCPTCLQLYCPNDGNCHSEPPEVGSGGDNGEYPNWNEDLIKRLNLVTIHIPEIQVSESIRALLELNITSLNSWFTDFVDRNIKIDIKTVTNSDRPIAYAEHSISNGLNGSSPYTIYLNSGFLQLSNHAQMTVLLNEFAHLYVYGQMSLADGDIKNLGTINSNLFVQLNILGLNNGAHEYFSMYKLDEISEILYQAMFRIR